MKTFIILLILIAIVLFVAVTIILKRSEKSLSDFYNNFKPTTSPAVKKLLKALELDVMPDSLEELNKVYKILAKKYHPDSPDGNTADFIRVTNAYEQLKKFF